MLISPAYAQATGGDSSSMLVQIAPLALIFVVFYFFLIRPQQQKAKQQRTMLDAIRRGDRIVTGGGVIGTVAKVVNNDEILVDIADNVRVRVLRSTIAQVLAKTEPVAAKEKDSSSDKGSSSDNDDNAAPKDGAASSAIDPKTQEPVPLWRKLLGLR